MKKLFIKLLLLTIPFLVAQSTFANNRQTNKLGVYVAALGSGFYTANIGYNAASFVRLHAGYGQRNIELLATDISVKIIDFGAKFLVPSWNFSPFLGLGYMIGSATATIDGASYTATGTGSTISLGLDYQASFGLNIGCALNLGGATGFGGYIGWYF